MFNEAANRLQGASNGVPRPDISKLEDEDVTLDLAQTLGSHQVSITTRRRNSTTSNPEMGQSLAAHKKSGLPRDDSPALDPQLLLDGHCHEVVA